MGVSLRRGGHKQLIPAYFGDGVFHDGPEVFLPDQFYQCQLRPLSPSGCLQQYRVGSPFGGGNRHQYKQLSWIRHVPVHEFRLFLATRGRSVELQCCHPRFGGHEFHFLAGLQFRRSGHRQRHFHLRPRTASFDFNQPDAFGLSDRNLQHQRPPWEARSPFPVPNHGQQSTDFIRCQQPAARIDGHQQRADFRHHHQCSYQPGLLIGFESFRQHQSSGYFCFWIEPFD